MKNRIIGGVILVAVGMLASQAVQAQGTTYLSNLSQPLAGSLTVGSDSWLAAEFSTGDNAAGYTLDSVQLAMANAFGNPSGFFVRIYGVDPNHITGAVPGSSLGTLDGSLSPVTSGIFTYAPATRITLSASTDYYIVLTAGTTIANGVYEWTYANPNDYNPSGGWYSAGRVFTSSDGSFSFWPRITVVPVQFAINATPVPEPGVLSLLGLGALGFLWHRRKERLVR